MKELKKEDIKQEIFDLYDAYAHNRLDRRQFMEKLSTYAVGGITVASLMSFKRPDSLKVHVSFWKGTPLSSDMPTTIPPEAVPERQTTRRETATFLDQ